MKSSSRAASPGEAVVIEGVDRLQRARKSRRVWLDGVTQRGINESLPPLHPATGRDHLHMVRHLLAGAVAYYQLPVSVAQVDYPRSRC